MLKKLSYTLLFIILFNPISFSFAKTKVVYEKALNLANTYIENSINDDSWFENNPKIDWKWEYYFTDDDKTPSYIEFKVSCDKEKNCWFILVNIDWDDVSVPIASTSWVWPSEILKHKSINSENNKLYYFWAFEQYIENLDNGDVYSINPNDNIENKLLNFKNLDKIELKEKEKIAKEELKQRLKKLKQEAKDYKKSVDFKNKKEEIKDQILQLPKEKFVVNNLDMSYASYTNPWTSDIIIPGWFSTSTCVWVTPCYDQFQTVYNWETCNVWCSPTAAWIVLWYYDRNWFPNLLPWTATLTNSYFVDNMIKDLWNIMWTECSGNTGVTYMNKISDLKYYAINKWYAWTTTHFSWLKSTSYIFSNIKHEIDNLRPIIIHTLWTPWHDIVWFWYKSIWNYKVARVNMWWWGISKEWIYYLSNIDQNLDAIYYNWSNNNIAWWFTKIIISN